MPEGQNTKPATVEWKTYGADLASTRYSPLDQINKDNFTKLQIAWRLEYQPVRAAARQPLLRHAADGRAACSTPRSGSRRAVVALNPGTGEMLLDAHRRRGRARAERAAERRRDAACRYWSSADGSRSSGSSTSRPATG